MFVKKIVRKVSKKKVSRKTKRNNVTKVVKRVLASQVEQKDYSKYGVNQTITTANATIPTFITCLPLLQQGTTQDTRIGQEVIMKYGRVQGYVNLLPYSPTFTPLSTAVMIKMWLVSSKLTNLNGLSNTFIGSGFFESGNQTIGFQGNLADIMLPVNTEAWTVHATKTFELGATSATTTGQVGTGGYYDNSKMILPFSFRFEKHFKSPLRYSDDAASLNGNYPYNRNLYLVFQAVYTDGGSQAYQVAEFHHSLNIKYTDM